MERKISLKSVLADKTSGSSEIVTKLNKYFSQNIKQTGKIKKELPEIKKTFSGFAMVNEYIAMVENLIDKNNIGDLNFFLAFIPVIIKGSFKEIYEKAEKHILKYNTILTLSNSKTLLKVFKMWFKKNKKLKIIVCESRPKKEGIILAKKLARAGIKTELICDALLSQYIKTSDAVIVGADAVLKNGNVVNKTGSRNAAIICKYYKKPFIVFAGVDKFTDEKSFSPKTENPEEILKGQIKNLTVNNFYFEEIEKELVTKIFTNHK